jgi:DNA-binding MarR family transcriptional regulator
MALYFPQKSVILKKRMLPDGMEVNEFLGDDGGMANAKRKTGAAAESKAGFTAFPPKESVNYQALLFARLLQGDYLSRIAATGLAPAQAYVLRELSLAAPLSQQDLARRLDIGKASTGETLDRLERAGLIVRGRDAADRRLVMVSLTEAGQALCPPLAQEACAQIELLRDNLGVANVEALTALLIRAVDAMRDVPKVDVIE